MMRGSTVARKVDLKEKRVHAPNPMTQEPFFSLLVVDAPTIPEIVVPTPVATPHMTTMSEGPEPVRQEPTQPIVAHERELQQPPPEDVPHEETQNVPEIEAHRRSQRVKKSAIPKDSFIIQKEFIWRMIPLHMKKP